MYIDQETAGENNFQSMGLRLGDNVTTLPKGTYTICVGGDSMTAIKTTTLTVAEKSTNTKSFKWGDVDGKDGVTGADASYIAAWTIGSSANVGGAYAINADYTLADGTKCKWGDVDGKDGVTGADASYIAAWTIGSSANVGGAYAINADATYKVE